MIRQDTISAILVIGFLIGFSACSATTPAGSGEPGHTESPQQINYRYGAGQYQVGSDIPPGIYAGRAGIGILESCYWARLSGASGELADIIANDNAVGQFYLEVLSTDRFLEVDCPFTPLSDWPTPSSPLSELGPGTYLIGRDITPGTFRGMAGTDILDSCYWERLSGLTGRLADIIANDNAVGQFYVVVAETDRALHTDCALERTGE